MGIIHFFGRYVIMTIIVAFMRKDIEAATRKVKREMLAEAKLAEQEAKRTFMQLK